MTDEIAYLLTGKQIENDRNKKDKILIKKENTLIDSFSRSYLI